MFPTNAPKVCTRSLTLNPQNAKTPWWGRGIPSPTPSPFNSFHKGCKSSIHPQVCTRSLILNLKILKLLYLFSGFLDRLCFLLKFRIDKYFKNSPKVCTRSLILNPKNAKTSWCGRGTHPPSAQSLHSRQSSPT